MAKKRNPTTEREFHQKIQKVKTQLDQLREMKKILRAEGIKPDEDDKRRESKYIQILMGLEKDLKRMQFAPKPETPKPPRRRR